MTHTYIKIELIICNGCRDNDRKVNENGMTEERNTICPDY